MSKKMGFWAVFALVVGSQIGSGVFMLPASLAAFGSVSLFGWLISGAGAVLLALVFAQLCVRLPRAGGPHAYVEAVFGRRAAFFVGWTYWLVSWISSAAVIIAAVSYLSPLLGNPSPVANLFLEILLIFAVTLLNMRGVAFSGSVEFILTLLKCIPLLVIPIIGLAYLNPAHFQFTGSGNLLGSLNQASLLTLWGFIGLETATVTARVIEEPGKTIPRAVFLGTLAVAFLYVLNSVGVMGVIPPEALMNEKAPYAAVSRVVLGNGCNVAVSLIAAVACIGTLNAWALTSGQIAYEAAQGGLFPRVFARTNRHSAPYVSLFIAFLGLIPFLILTLHEGLIAQINRIIDLSVTTFLMIYSICILSFMVLVRREGKRRFWLLGFAALGFCGWALFSVSWVNLCLCALFAVSGIPVYLWQAKRGVAVSS